MSLLGSLAQAARRLFSDGTRSESLLASTRRLDDYADDHPLRQSNRHVPRYADRERGEITRPEYVPLSDRRVITNEESRLAASGRETALAGAAVATPSTGAAAAYGDDVDLSGSLSDAAEAYVGDR